MSKDEINDETIEEIKEELDEVEAQQQPETDNEPQQPDYEELLKQKDETIQQYKDKLQRIHADFENFKKRSEKEKQEFVKYANEGVILNMIEIYEDLQRALQVENDKDLKEGVELIYKKFTKTLKDEGVEEIPAEHEKFDPYKHEAMLTENNPDYENNEIIQDLQKGYTLNDKVIRYSKVKVCKK